MRQNDNVIYVWVSIASDETVLPVFIRIPGLQKKNY